MHPYTIEHLSSREVLDHGKAKPARLAVIGYPVKHSASPRMHQPALDEAGVTARYIAVEVEPGRVSEAFSRMRDLGFIGCNITVPHKFEALKTCDQLDTAAEMLGAVNTVSFSPTSIKGTNTDGYGFEHAVAEALQTGIQDSSIFIAGAGGGAGGAIAAHCVMAGARRVVLANRTLSKLDPLIARISGHGTEVIAVSLNDVTLPELASQCGLVVNTSSLGLRHEDSSPVPAECFHSGQAVFDTIYQPPLTEFLRLAENAGARIANGKGMLLHQGVKAFTTWFPESTPEAAMRRGLG